MKRQASESITHLVKIVAKEVMNEEINEKMEELKGFVRDEMLHNAQDELRHVKNACMRAGETWTKAEEDKLDHEVRMAIKQIAQNHQRSPGAIIERVRQKDILTNVQMSF